MQVHDTQMQPCSCQHVPPTCRTHHRLWHSHQTPHSPRQSRITTLWHHGVQQAPRPTAAAACMQSADSTLHLLRSHSLPMPPVLQSSPQSMFNAVSMAFLGDAIWEALSRQHAWKALQPSTSVKQSPPGVKQLHHLAVSKANATQQAVYHDLLVASSSSSKASGSTDQGSTPPHTPKASDSTVMHSAMQLSEIELEVLRWARNSSSLNIPAGVDSLVYKKATALEALVAHLYLTEPRRCIELVTALLNYVPKTS